MNTYKVLAFNGVTICFNCLDWAAYTRWMLLDNDLPCNECGNIEEHEKHIVIAEQSVDQAGYVLCLNSKSEIIKSLDIGLVEIQTYTVMIVSKDLVRKGNPSIPFKKMLEERYGV